MTSVSAPGTTSEDMNTRFREKSRGMAFLIIGATRAVDARFFSPYRHHGYVMTRG